MNFIVILASLVLDRHVDESKSLRALDVINTWVNRGLARAGHNTWLAVVVFAIAIVAPALLAHWIAHWLAGGWLGLLALIWSIVVLFFCLGPVPIESELSAYIEAVDAGEEEVADDRARRLAGHAEFGNESERNWAVIRALFGQVNTQIITAVFWFIVMGPFGAVLYRITLQLALNPQVQSDSPDDTAERLQTLLGIFTWLPARILLLAYALAGKFECTLNSLLGPTNPTTDSTLFDNTNAALAEAGCCALGKNVDADAEIDDVQSTHQLILRALIVCLAGLALMTLSGWFA